MTTTAHPATSRTTGRPIRHRHWLRTGWVMTASGWSANQFSALLGAYHAELGLTGATTTALFGVYVLGLIPGLFLGGPAADRRGRRPVVFAALTLSALATVLLMAGSMATGLLWPGRFLTGIGAGALLSAGSAWIKELSSLPYDTHSTAGAAARRSGLFLSAGFATGGLVAALIAQWAPAPMITAYLPHLVLSVTAALLASRAPETARTGGRGPARTPDAPATAPAPATTPAPAPHGTAPGAAFRRLVAPVAPWVFVAPSIALATLPGLVDAGLTGWQTVYAGILTAVTPGAGLLVAPFARRLAARHRIATAVAGLAAVIAGLLLAAFAVARIRPDAALLAAAVLGAGYGLCVAYGLTEVAALAPPEGLARLTARFWALCYLGFCTPYAITLLTGLFAPATVLLAAVVPAAATLALIARRGAHRGARRGARPAA
ncbi:MULTISPECIES: MFS transporter [unclassified Streptomyces]|uniref:MFS transporter n=1 Tax=unclassified Streptomyces TaxID=2593676 RepID=UPI00088F8E7B|nr:MULTISPECIES: MFS transporter [unclassified Streptomyces]PBC83365.1 MFS transporter [Streptomyces sp. 2321.6]SDR43043.1 Major Facilitator Superfamily protein [Streptomyces sp. KS_16]SEC94052.1 Major Facilitator Superfamily protein [Streptomyces sp. 2133.1]SNC69443.1 Major Facilitator Superfamily protein [Streptomyces sp. 2114.4]